MTPQTLFRFILRVVSIGLIVLGATMLASSAEQKVRPPAVAGGFYPADPSELGKMVDMLLSRVTVPALDGSLVALISPHAGYPYSGQVAAHAYALLKGKTYDRVVVIAPSHLEAFPFSAVYDGDAYATPLGTIPVDKDFTAKLAGQSPLIRLSNRVTEKCRAGVNMRWKWNFRSCNECWASSSWFRW